MVTMVGMFLVSGGWQKVVLELKMFKLSSVVSVIM